jgi:hypothetical protein
MAQGRPGSHLIDLSVGPGRGQRRFSAEPEWGSRPPTALSRAADTAPAPRARCQFTDTADQAAPTARYSALLAPYRSFAALSVATRAPAYFVDDVM